MVEKCGEPAGGPVQGVDVSVYQGNFDWAAAHVAFGYARISDGVRYVDPTFDGNWARMKAAGVLRGAYQFFEASEDETAQANLMVQKVGRLQPGDLPPMIDVEVTDNVAAATIGARVLHWLQIVEAGTGRRPIIYTGSYFWEDNVGTNLSSYPIWIAAYGPSCPSLPQDGWSNWAFWQYSDGGGNLDHDVFNGSLGSAEGDRGVVNRAAAGEAAAADGLRNDRAGARALGGRVVAVVRRAVRPGDVDGRQSRPLHGVDAALGVAHERYGRRDRRDADRREPGRLRLSLGTALVEQHVGAPGRRPRRAE